MKIFYGKKYEYQLFEARFVYIIRKMMPAANIFSIKSMLVWQCS